VIDTEKDVVDELKGPSPRANACSDAESSGKFAAGSMFGRGRAGPFGVQ
jgi:hypothetical protein